MYRIKLSAFEGPFDLLVYLIEHAQMSIYDIKISEITDQYLKHVAKMKEADIEMASEFMVLAAELLEIKSKMLLPRSVMDESGTEVYEDPRTELVERLREYKKYKAISDMLESKYDEASMQLEKPKEDLSVYTGEADEYLVLDIDRFTVAFEAFLQRKKKLEQIRSHHIRTAKQRITTEKRMADIREFFRGTGDRETDFENLVHEKDNKYDIAVTFSSVLEMMKERRLDADQKRLFGNIKVKATEYIFEGETANGREQSN